MKMLLTVKLIMTGPGLLEATLLIKECVVQIMRKLVMMVIFLLFPGTIRSLKSTKMFGYKRSRVLLLKKKKRACNIL
jgi:hypothetical protein